MSEFPTLDLRSERERLFETGQPGDGMGGLWDAVGQIGAAVGSSILPSLISGGSAAGGQAKGSAAIYAFGQQTIQALSQILQMYQAGQLSAADAVSNAQRIAGYLSNSQYVYQAQHGDDAAKLQAAKAAAAQLVQQIQNAVAAAPATPASSPAVTVNPVTGEVTPAAAQVAGNVSIAGLSLSPLELGIAAVALYLILK